MRNGNEINCDICKNAIDNVMDSQTIVIRSSVLGDQAYPDVCKVCGDKISDFIISLKKVE